MRKKILFVIPLAVLAAIAGETVILTAKNNNQACFKNSCFDVELAKTSAEISRGLMFRRNLGQNQGMLFVFDKEEDYPFWMKNTLIPLDIIWINENGRVVFINGNSQPCEKDYACVAVDPRKKAKYVLEVKAETATKIGLKVGDKINLPKL